MKIKTNRITALTMAAVMTLGSSAALTGCGRQREDGATLEISMDNSWRSTQLKAKQGYTPVHAWGNCLLLSRSNSRTFIESFQFINTETGETVDFDPKCAEERSAASNHIGCRMVIEYADGSVGLVMYEQNQRGGKFERYCIEIYDAQMNYLRTEEIPKEFYNGKFLSGAVDNQGNWYIFDGGPLVLYNSKYEKYGEIKLPEGTQGIMEMVRGKKDGTMYVSVQKNANGTDYFEFYEVNAANCTMESTGVFNSQESIEKHMTHESITIYHDNDFVNGGTGYDFCWSDINGLYGYKDGEETQIISWVNSDFPVGEVSEAYFMENGSVVARTGSFSSPKYYLCTPRTQEEIDNTKLISLSTLGLFTALESAVIDYNKAESGYRIVVVDYNQYNTKEDDTLGAAKLREDMLNGIVADMVCTDGMQFENLANKGLFADWYDLMDADDSFNREDYLQNFFHAYEYDDKLQRLAVQYSVHTTAAKTEFAEGLEGMSLSQLPALIDSVPEGMDLYATSSREWFVEEDLPYFMNAFVDAKQAKCYFDTEGFTSILTHISELPTNIQLGEMWESESPDLPPSYNEQHLAFQQNRAFIATDVFYQPIDFRAMNRLTFHDEPVTMVGIPMDYDEGNGGLFRADFTVSVNAQSEQRTAIWDFMKHLLQEEYQSSLNDSFPVHKGALEAKLEQTMHMVGAKEFFGAGEAHIGESNPEEMGKLRTYLEGIQTAYYYNQTVYDIMMEEMAKYFSGDCTAQECGRLIQSRVSIYLSEQS